MRRLSTLIIACCTLLFSAHAGATGLHSIGTDAEVYIDTVNVEVDVHGAVADAVMEFTFGAKTGSSNFASLRFPLPPGSVIHKAEVYLPDQERWETARTLGRREAAEAAGGQDARPEAPLLLQHIGKDFYRAQVSPIDDDQNLRLRVHYAHPLEKTPRGQRLRVAFANPDSTASTPTNGLKVVVRTDIGTWYEGVWDHGDGDAVNASFDPQEGFGRIGFGRHPLGEDVSLKLNRESGPLSGYAVRWIPQRPDRFEEHIFVTWAPDLSNVEETQPAPRNVVFVIDNSGSMAGDKLLQTKIAVGRAIESLNGRDRFGLVAFGSEAKAYSSEMRAGDDVEGALRWLSELETAGGTNMEAGIRKAMGVGLGSDTDRTIDLMLVSDGHPNTGADDAEQLLDIFRSYNDPMSRERRIFALGMGYDLSQDFLNFLALSTGGDTTHALDDSAVTGQFLELVDRARQGGLFDLDIRMQAADVVDTYSPRRLFPGETVALGIRARGAEQVKIDLEGFAGEDYTFVRRSAQLDLTEQESLTVAAPLAAAAQVRKIQRRTWSETERTLSW